MGSPLDALRAGGFSEDEITVWSTQRRDVLAQAGFKDNEIDAYFLGGVTVPETVPQAVEDRIEQGNVARKREGGLLQTIPAFADMLSTPDGRGRLWNAVKKYPEQFIKSTVETLATPGDVLQQKIDLTTDEGFDRAIGLGALIGLGRFGKLPQTGKTSGLSVAMGEPVARIERTPLGEIVDQPVGTLPKVENFVDAAKVVADETAPMAVQEKLLTIYEGKGQFPAEVAADAQRDSVVHQRLLSKDPLDVPYYSLADIPDIWQFNPAEPIPKPKIELARQAMENLGFESRHTDAFFRDILNLRQQIADNIAKTQVSETPHGAPAIISEFEIKPVDITTPPDFPPPRVFSSGEEQLAALRLKYRHALDDFLGGYKFNQRDPVPRPEIEAARKAFENLGFESRHVDSFFADIQGTRIVEAPQIPKTQTTETPAGPPRLFGDFEIKPLEAPKEQLPPREGTLKSAQEEVGRKISVGEKQEKTLTLRKAYTEAIDDLHPLHAVSESAYEMARLTRGQFGKAGYFLEQATFDFNTYKNTGKPLAEILKPVRNDLNGLRLYLASKRAIELEEAGLKSGIDFLAARQIVTEGNKKYAQIADEIVNYQNRLLKYLKDAGVLTDEAFDAMVQANKNYVPFFRLITPEKPPPGSGSQFGPGNPIHRLKGSERDIIDPIESIIKNTYAYISIAERNAVGIEIIDALKKKGYAVETTKRVAADADLVEHLKSLGVDDPAKLADFIKNAVPETGENISAWRNGVRETIKIDDPELVTAFRGLDRQSVGMLTRIFAIPARTLRAGAVLTPDFIARNLIRDFLSAFINTKGAVFSPIDSFKGLLGLLRRDADWGNWVKSGGANSTMVALDRAYLQESLSKLSGETGLMQRSWNVISFPVTGTLRGLRAISETVENATRLGEFKKLAATDASKDVLQSAAYSAREVTLDFARMGARMKGYNMVTAFANAQIQGIDRIVRAFKDQPLETSMKVAGGITLPSVLLWWANHGDARYEELPNWQKDLFWIILTDKWEPISATDAAAKPQHLVRERNGQWQFNNGSIYRIPKPFELGVIFGSGAERLLSATIGKDPKAWDDFTKSMIQAFTPNFIPTAVQPVVEQYSNRSTFTDRTLIPADLEKQLPEYQYTPYTTQLSRALGQIISSFPGMHEAGTKPGHPAGPMARSLSSPILIENYVRSWTGGLGMYALEAADTALRKAGVLPDPIKPTATLADIPFVKAFVVRYPSATTQSIQDFHDNHLQAKRYFDTWMARAREGDAEAMARIQAAGGPQMMLRLDGINQVLSEHSKLIRDIYKNPTMPADEKRQLIDSLYYTMIEIARAGVKLQDSIKRPPVP